MRRIHSLDDYDLDCFIQVAASFTPDRYGYVVTPNVDHLIRWHDDAAFRDIYTEASYVLLDSRFLSKLLRMTRGIRTAVCPGSDLTAKLFTDVIAPDDSIVMLGGSAEQAHQLATRFGLRALKHFNPPMGFIRDPQQVETALQFIEQHSPFRFCLLAVGVPQQEMLALRLKQRGIARGLTLCVGASVNFLTGAERRAPAWLQRLGCEWLYRLLQDPRRLAKRYLLRGPRIFGLLQRTVFVVRPAAAPKRLS
jgi:exopolysaccharide biosynthesis WecB/TagA/CpsF family protein